MKFTQLSGAAMTAVLVAALSVPQVGGAEPADTPTAEAVSAAKPIPAELVPTAEPIPTAEPVSAAASGPMAEPVPTAKPIPAKPIPAEPIPSAEPVSAAEAVPASEPVSITGKIPTARPFSVAEKVTVAEPVPGSEEVPRPNMNLSTGKVSTVEQALATEPVLNGKLLSDSEPVPTTGMLPIGETGPGGEVVAAPGMVLSADGIPTPVEDSTGVDPAEADPDKEGKMTLRELAIQSHREQMAIYDLDGDNQISEEEWKAANEENLARGEKFFLVDEDEDGKIDENEAVGFLMNRVSLSSTYLDAAGDEAADVTRDEIKKHAPSELRVTLFSIPLGD